MSLHHKRAVLYIVPRGALSDLLVRVKNHPLELGENKGCVTQKYGYIKILIRVY